MVLPTTSLGGTESSFGAPSPPREIAFVHPGEQSIGVPREDFLISCLACGLTFEPRPWQLKKRDFRCVACNRRKWNDWRAKNSEHRAAYEQAHKHPRSYVGRHAKKSSDPRYRMRRKAMAQLAYAIKRGDIIRCPCEVCGETRSQAHHHDYSKPLEVKWLCAKHHRQLHAGILRP